MIVVRVELYHATTGRITELARMHIINDATGTPALGNYEIEIMRGRSRSQLSKRIVQRQGKVARHPRLKDHVWHLVAKALKVTNYGGG